jgi:hypothetical protein
MRVGVRSDAASVRDSAMGFDIPESCTLPTAAHPARQGEFEALFATALSAQRVGPVHLRLCFAGSDALASTVRDVAARESVCCSFFDFTVCVDADRVLLDVRVPPARAEVLDGMTALASAGGRCERERRAH